MIAQLHIALNGEGSPRELALSATCAIGRDHDNDVVINDARVSRRHALIRLLSDNRYYVMDLGSSNGTFLNGRPVTVPVQLNSGDKVQIGGSNMIFDWPGELGADFETSGLDAEPNTVQEFAFQTAAVLVVDIRGYTHLTEAIPTAKLAKFVGGWFREVSQMIEQHGGTIDKFIGDAVLAYWLKAQGTGAPNFVTSTLVVAQNLLQLSETYHTNLSQQYPGLSFRIGCGIHMGQVALGNIGKAAARDFTVVGDCVNVAFRIESLCREIGRPILLSQEIKDSAGPTFGFDDCGLREVKGKIEPIRVFALGAQP